MSLGASPSLVGCSFLGNSLGCRGIPKLRLFYPSFIHRKITQNLKTSITQNSTKPLWDPLVKESKPLLWVLYQTNSYFILYYIYCIPTFLWQKVIKQNHRAIKISTQHKENRICQNRTVCSNLTFANTSGTPKILQN